MRLWSVSLGLALAALAAAQPADRLYPSGRLDQAGTQGARSVYADQPQLEVTVFTTDDPFEKVLSFFQKRGREYKVIGSRVRRLPNGQELRDAFFILDDAPSLLESKRWVKLQRPYIGESGLARNPSAQDIRDLTAIVLSTRK